MSEFDRCLGSLNAARNPTERLVTLLKGGSVGPFFFKQLFLIQNELVSVRSHYGEFPAWYKKIVDDVLASIAEVIDPIGKPLGRAPTLDIAKGFAKSLQENINTLIVNIPQQRAA